MHSPFWPAGLYKKAVRASSLPGSCDTPGEWRQQLGEPTPAITPGVHRHPWPTLSPLVYTVTPAYTVTPGLHSHPCIHHHLWHTPSPLVYTVTPAVQCHLCINRQPWHTPSPLAYTVTPAYTITPAYTVTPVYTITPGVYRHPWRTPSPLAYNVTPAYTVTPGVHRHPWRTPSPVAYTVTPAYTVIPGVHRHHSRTLSPLAYTVTPGLHCHPCIHRHPWCTLSPLEETVPPGGGLSVLTDGWRSQTLWPARCHRTPSAVRPGTGQGRRHLDTPEDAKHRVRHAAELRAPTEEREVSRAAGRPGRAPAAHLGCPTSRALAGAQVTHTSSLV